MTYQATALDAPARDDAGRQLTQLRHVLELVVEIAGLDSAADAAALEDGAHVTAAYQQALPIAQRRFDTLAAEIVGWASAGVEALIAAADAGRPARAAAGRLAAELGRSLNELAATLRR